MQRSVARDDTWRRAIRRWREWFRRNAWQAVLTTLLAFSMLEPLACIVHCWPWLPASAHDGAVASHSYHQSWYPSSEPSARSEDPTAGVLAISLLAQDPCAMSIGRSIPSESPTVPTLTLHHDHLAALIALVPLAIAALVCRCRPIPLHPPPEVAYPPPLRPPLVQAALH